MSAPVESSLKTHGKATQEVCRFRNAMEVECLLMSPVGEIRMITNYSSKHSVHLGLIVMKDLVCELHGKDAIRHHRVHAGVPQVNSVLDWD